MTSGARRCINERVHKRRKYAQADIRTQAAVPGGRQGPAAARRLELRQDKNYGADPEYQKYVRTVPIIIPFIPLYSVKKYKFLVA